MKNLDLSNVLYSHTEYSDLWPMFFCQMQKYFPDLVNIQKNFIFVDKASKAIYSNYSPILYKNSDTYVKRLLHCLKQIKTKYCLFSHEDMILYDHVKVDKIKKYINIMDAKNLDIIKLIKDNECEYFVDKNDSTLFHYVVEKSKWMLCIQPSIWNVSSIIKVLKKHKKLNIWELEEVLQKTCIKLGIQGAFAFDEGKQRGMYHYDSTIYPYISTAVVKGKWNIKEYGYILDNLIKEYHIDIKSRGEIL